MTGRDLSLQYVWTWRGAQLFGMFERYQTTTDEKLVPVCAVLSEEQDGFPRPTRARERDA